MDSFAWAFVTIVLLFLLSAMVSTEEVAVAFPLIQPTAGVLLIISCAVVALCAATRKNVTPLAWVLGVYLWTSLGFAGVYYTAFFYAPRSFAFSSSISSKAHVAALDRHYEVAKQAFRSAGLLREVRVWMAGTDDKEAEPLMASWMDQEWHIPHGITVRHGWTAIQDPTTSVSGSSGPQSTSSCSVRTLNITDADGTVTWTGFMGGEHSTALGAFGFQDELPTKKKYLAELAEIEVDEVAVVRSAAAVLRSA